jgi:hypothetical protein
MRGDDVSDLTGTTPPHDRRSDDRIDVVLHYLYLQWGWRDANRDMSPGPAPLCQNSERRKPVEIIRRLSSLLKSLWDRHSAREWLCTPQC